MRPCSKCSQPTERRGYCKPCSDEYNRAYHAANRERLNARKRRVGENRVTCSAEGCTTQPGTTGLCAQHRGCEAEGCPRPHYSYGKCKKHYGKLPSEKAWQQRYDREQNPSNKRRTRLAGGGVFTILPSELARVKNSACSNCGSRDRIELDHIVPVTRGGRHSIGNLQPLCKSCNSTKGNALQVEWRYGVLRKKALV